MKRGTPSLVRVNGSASAVRRAETDPDDGVTLIIPSRHMPTRRAVATIYQSAPHLGVIDMPAVLRYCSLALKARRISERLDEVDLMTANGEVRKAVGELRALSDSLLRHEQALGLVPTSRAQLGIDIAKLRAASRDEHTTGDIDVDNVEARLLERLSAGTPVTTGDSSSPVVADSTELTDADEVTDANREVNAGGSADPFPHPPTSETPSRDFPSPASNEEATR